MLADVDGVQLVASCGQDDQTTTVTSGLRSSSDATLQETVITDTGQDIANAQGTPQVFNLQVQAPAGQLLGGPMDATSGFARVAANALVTTATQTVSFQATVVVDAEQDHCAVNGVALAAR